jgi:hypothetical protein
MDIKVVYNENGYGLFLSDKSINFLMEHGVHVNQFGDLSSGKKLERHHPALVECVESLGKDAGKFETKFKIASISCDENAKYFVYQMPVPGEKIITPDNLCFDWVEVATPRELAQSHQEKIALEKELLSIKEDVLAIKDIIKAYKEEYSSAY